MSLPNARNIIISRISIPIIWAPAMNFTLGFLPVTIS